MSQWQSWSTQSSNVTTVNARGIKFTVDTAITVTHIGVSVANGAGLIPGLTLKIWRVSDTTEIASVTHTPSATGLTMAALASSVELAAATEYIIAVGRASGSFPIALWYETTSTQWYNQTVAGVEFSAYGNYYSAATTTGYPSTLGSANGYHFALTFTAASGGTTQNLSASITGTATVTGALERTAALQATITGTASTTAALGLKWDLAATVSGTASASAALALTKDLAATVAGSGSTTAVLDRTANLAASISASASTSGALERTAALAATVSSTASTTAALTVTQAGVVDLAGTAGGVAQTAATPWITRVLGTVATGAASATATMQRTAVLIATATGTAATSATTAITRGLKATVNGTATTVAAILRTLGLTSAASGQATASGSLDVVTIAQHDLSATVKAGATATATLYVDPASPVIPGKVGTIGGVMRLVGTRIYRKTA